MASKFMHTFYVCSFLRSITMCILLWAVSVLFRLKKYQIYLLHIIKVVHIQEQLIQKSLSLYIQLCIEIFIYDIQYFSL